MVVVSHDPRGLVDTTPGGSVNEETALLARELSAGGLAASRTDLNLKKAGLSELPPQIGTRVCLTRSHRAPHGLLRAACTGGAGQPAPGPRTAPASDISMRAVAPGALRSLTKLDVSLNALKSLPTEVAGLASLRILFSLGNQFEEVPPVLRGLPSLYMLSFKSNKLARIGEEALAPTVAWLILTDNRLTSLPRSIGQCTNLRKCMLTDNRLNHS